MDASYLESIRKLFLYYKQLGDKAMAQLSEEQLFYVPSVQSNSIAMIVKHLWGNMLSRWTDFLTTDGEKEWRNREAEFENDLLDKADLLAKWETGWACLMNALNQLQPADLEKIIYIRNEGQTVVDAINRQLAHYASHVGQIVYLAKMQANDQWKILSIPKGQSQQYNAGKFAQPPTQKHFTDDWIDKK